MFTEGNVKWHPHYQPDTDNKPKKTNNKQPMPLRTPKGYVQDSRNPRNYIKTTMIKRLGIRKIDDNTFIIISKEVERLAKKVELVVQAMLPKPYVLMR